MNGKRQRTVGSVLSSALTVFVVVLAVGLVFKYTKAGERIKDLTNSAFCVEYAGKEYTGENNVITLPTDGQAMFTVKGCDGYTVKIVPNVTVETDFTYTVNGRDILTAARICVRYFLRASMLKRKICF